MFGMLADARNGAVQLRSWLEDKRDVGCYNLLKLKTIKSHRVERAEFPWFVATAGAWRARSRIHSQTHHKTPPSAEYALRRRFAETETARGQFCSARDLLAKIRLARSA